MAMLAAWGEPVLVEFLVAVLVLEITPGPNLGYLAALSATHGRRAGLAATAGVALGLSMHAVAAAVGVGALIAAHPWAYELLRWAGVAVLVWLAYEGWVGEREAAPAAALSGPSCAGLFWRGFWTNLLNPKSALFLVTVVPRFLEPTHQGTLRLALLGAIYVSVATAVHGTVVLLAATLQPHLAGGRRGVIVRKTLAVVLLLIAAWLAWGTRR